MGILYSLLADAIMNSADDADVYSGLESEKLIGVVRWVNIGLNHRKDHFNLSISQ